APSTSPDTSSSPRLSCSYNPSSTRRARSTPSRDPATLTGLPRCSATTPSRRSIRARFWPYWPNSIEASRLSSNASTIWVAALSLGASGEDTREPLSDRGARNCSALRQHRFGAHRRFHERPKQAVGTTLRHFHRCGVFDHCRGSHDLNRLEIWGAPDDLARIASRFVEQDLEGAANALRVEFGLVAVDRRLQTVEPFGFHFVGDLIVHFRGRRSGPGGVLERKGAGVVDLVDERQSRAEIVLALAGETDDEIRRERKIRTRVSRARDGIEIVRAGVTAVHRGQDAIGTRLYRQGGGRDTASADCAARQTVPR